MTKQEVLILIRSIDAIFSDLGFEKKPEKKQAEVVNNWHFVLGEYDANLITLAYRSWLKTSGSAFAPKPTELIAELGKVQKYTQLNEGEAWALVRKAINNGNYNAQREFDKLDSAIQAAIGGASQLHEWAQTDIKTVESVIASNFERAYRNVLERQQQIGAMPPEMRALIENTTNKMLEAK